MMTAENINESALDKTDEVNESRISPTDSKPAKKKRTSSKKAAEQTADKDTKTIVNDDMEPINEIMTPHQIHELIEAITELVFLNTANGTTFAPIYIDLMLAYWKIGFFYPSLETSEKGVDYFFEKWISGEYDVCLEKLENNRQARVIDKAIRREIEFKKAQLCQPIINSLTELADSASELVKKYTNDINSEDIKGFMKQFAEFSSKNNTATITDEVLKHHRTSLPFPATQDKNNGHKQNYNK